MVNSDCVLSKACSNQKCRDPCPGTCGIGAKCHVVNHNPICSCPPGFTGNAFVQCNQIRKSLFSFINLPTTLFLGVIKI